MTADLVARLFCILCLLVLTYVYFGYPLLLLIFSKSTNEEKTAKGSSDYTISLVIPAYNESQVIRAKLDNSLAIYYPRENLEILVASDGSEDGTNEIARDYEKQGIKLLAYSPRAGKISVLNRAIPEANGDIIILCDANVMFLPDAVGRLVAYFADPAVGAVTGDVRIQSADAPFGEGEGLYYKYERFIQSCESRLGSIIGVDGGMYAIRKKLFQPLPADTILDDFIISMNIAIAGKRVLYDPMAVATENATMDVRQEFRRKVRITAGGFKELLRGHGVPTPFRPQLFWSYVSHKLLRWLVPWFLLLILVSTIILVAIPDDYWLMAITLLVLQLLFYGLALIGCTRPNARWPAPIGIPFYFCMVNAAAFLGFFRGVFALERVTWKKADR